MLIATFSSVFRSFLLGTGLTIAATYNYQTTKVDANDLSFYQPSITAEPYPPTSATQVRNVILCIGDGMGISQVTLAGATVAGPGGKLHLERLPVTGLVADLFRRFPRDGFRCGRDRPGLRHQDQERHDRNDPRRAGILLDSGSRQGQGHGHRPGRDLHDEPRDARLLRLAREVAASWSRPSPSN